MEVVRATCAGACYGVQRALDMALAAAEAGGVVRTLGPLIHNPLVVEELARRGALVAEGLDEVRGGTVVIRSHGVPPAIREELARRADEVVDATCPHVARAQAAAAELASEGCRVLVVGEEGHPEVEGLMACVEQAGGAVDVVAGPDDVPEGLYDPVGVVVQTTQMRESLDAVVERLEALGLHPQVRSTICSATRQRQRAASELASQVDAMVVIGGRNSSNTTRLAQICAASCERSFHIESAEELGDCDLAGCERVGVTAGASTPESQIAAVMERLSAL